MHRTDQVLADRAWAKLVPAGTIRRRLSKEETEKTARPQPITHGCLLSCRYPAQRRRDFPAPTVRAEARRA